MEPLQKTNDIMLSSAEKPEVIERLREEFTLIHCAGAGYKLLAVALGLCSVYLCSKGSTHRWDTCAPQALLEAQGGGVRQFVEDKPIPYDVEQKDATKNAGGIVAYRDKEFMERVMALLKE